MTYEEVEKLIKYYNQVVKDSRSELSKLFIIREEIRNEDQINIDDILKQ